MDKRVKKAEDNYEAAARALIAAVIEAYPIGTRMSIESGGHIIVIEVTGHEDSWWYSPGQMFGRNIKTNNVRKFFPSQMGRRRPTRKEKIAQSRERGSGARGQGPGTKGT